MSELDSIRQILDLIREIKQSDLSKEEMLDVFKQRVSESPELLDQLGLLDNMMGGVLFK